MAEHTESKGKNSDKMITKNSDGIWDEKMLEKEVGGEGDKSRGRWRTKGTHSPVEARSHISVLGISATFLPLPSAAQVKGEQ